jgi:RNA recognition motif-containing protein
MPVTEVYPQADRKFIIYMSTDSQLIPVQNNKYAIFVGGLSNTVTNHDLLTYFRKFGDLLTCEAQMWKNNPSKCRGFAKIAVRDRGTFEAILGAQHKMGGRVIECKKMIEDKEELETFSKDQLERKIFVSGLSKKVDDNELLRFFSQFGAVKMAYVVKHHKDQKSKGFGYVCFDRKEDKDKVLSLKYIDFQGKNIHLSEYSTKFELKKSKAVDSKEEDRSSCMFEPADDATQHFESKAGSDWMSANSCVTASHSIKELPSPSKVSSDNVRPHTRNQTEMAHYIRQAGTVHCDSSSQAQPKLYNPFLGVHIQRSGLSRFIKC